MSRRLSCTALVPPPLWASLAPPNSSLDMVVVLPVRSEVERLPATLAALAAQVGFDGRPLPAERFEVIVLANNCADASAEIVRGFASDHPDLAVHVAEVTFSDAEAHVGQARACLMDEACRRLHSVGRESGIIASTDGDTHVASDWLAAIRREVDEGADAVGGKIEIIDEASLPAGLLRLARRDAVYQQLRSRLEHVIDPNPADPWPRHHQHFGANLAITAKAYLQVGGLPPQPFLEDEALCQAVLAHDLKLRHSHNVVVSTSNRREGRVEVGLSWQLRQWSSLAATDAMADPEVEDPIRFEQQLVMRRRLRAMWSTFHAIPCMSRPTPAMMNGLIELDRSLDVSSAWLSDRMQSSETFGSLWLAVAARRQPEADSRAAVRIPMREAIASLRSLLASHGDAPLLDQPPDSNM